MCKGKSKPSEEAVVLGFVNLTGAAVTVNWVDYAGKEVEYATLQPQGSYHQATWATHLWRMRSAPGDALLAEYVGATATVTVAADGTSSASPGLRARSAAPAPHPTDPAAGVYRERAAVRGIPICAYDCVCDSAVAAAELTLRRMLEGVDESATGRMAEYGASVAIIGRRQATTDIPAHAHLKGQTTHDGRDFDAGTRGLGGNLGCPATSVGEENVLMHGDSRYPSESILVHEFAHAVMCLGLHGTPRRREIEAAYKAAVADGLYAAGSYIASNSDEYFAEGTQAWFHATVRLDVTSGITTRAALKKRDPRLAAAMAGVWGDGAWRFTDTAPAAFQGRGETRRRGWCCWGCAGGAAAAGRRWGPRSEV